MTESYRAIFMMNINDYNEIHKSRKFSFQKIKIKKIGLQKKKNNKIKEDVCC